MKEWKPREWTGEAAFARNYAQSRRSFQRLWLLVSATRAFKNTDADTDCSGSQGNRMEMTVGMARLVLYTSGLGEFISESTCASTSSCKLLFPLLPRSGSSFGLLSLSSALSGLRERSSFRVRRLLDIYIIFSIASSDGLALC